MHSRHGLRQTGGKIGGHAGRLAAGNHPDAAFSCGGPQQGKHLLLILGPPVFFGLFIRELGLIPCLALVAFVSSFASRLAKLPLSILLAILLTLFCVAVFIYGLGLPIPLIGRWLGGH